MRGHGNRRPFQYDRVDRGFTTPCWDWAWSCNDEGYGRTYLNGQLVSAHRVLYERIKGPIPPGMMLDHLCRNHRCVNPDHLEPVTNAENCRRGIKAKLTASDALAIRALAERGVRQRDIAAQFGVTQAQVSNIVRRRQWADI